ncbi:MAG: outer membrane beta-barrel protein [Candidatus Omnitrophica bacterium]|nr:outer membrane beta-barrel protein [Candidatus Omnitrophota bacterium]
MSQRNIFIFILLGAVSSPVVYAFQLGTLDIKPVVSIKEKFDDNVRYSETNKISDWVMFLSMGLEGKRETKVDTLSFNGSILQKIFGKENDLNGLSQQLGLKYKRDLSAYDRVTVSNNFTHADEATTLEDEFGRVAGRYNYYKNFLKLGLEHDFTEQLTGKLRYANETYSASINTVSDSVLNRPGMELAYAFSSRTIGSVSYDYANRAFDPDGTVHIHTTQGGIRQFLTNQVYVDVKAGINQITTTDDRHTTKPNFLVGIYNDIDPTTQVGLTFSRSYDVAYSYSELFNNWNANLFWSRQLTSRLNLTLAGFSGAGKFDSGVKDKFNGVNTSLEYELKENIKSNLGYSFTRSDSSQAGSDYDKNTVFMGITVEF